MLQLEKNSQTMEWITDWNFITMKHFPQQFGYKREPRVLRHFTSIDWGRKIGPGQWIGFDYQNENCLFLWVIKNMKILGYLSWIVRDGNAPELGPELEFTNPNKDVFNYQPTIQDTLNELLLTQEWERIRQP